MPTEYVLQTPAPEKTASTQPIIKKPYLLPALIAGGVILVIVATMLGFIIGKGIGQPQAVIDIPSPTPKSPTTPSLVVPSITASSDTPAIAMLPDKQYFEDSYIVIQKAAPHATLILSVSRIEQKENFTQFTRVNYFDGKTWDRKSVLGTNQSAVISTNPLLRSWNDPATVLLSPDKQLGSISLLEQTIAFSSTNLQNEISLQSLPGSTKFMYQGNGTILLDGEREQAHIFYSRTYSFNASDLSYLLKPSLLTSSWMVFWDADGTFYHLDSHSPLNPTSSAQVLKIGVRVENGGLVRRTQEVSSEIETGTTARLYKQTFGDIINEELILLSPTTSTFDKSDKKAYSWYLSTGEGTAVKKEGRTVKGVGFIEQISGFNAKR